MLKRIAFLAFFLLFLGASAARETQVALRGTQSGWPGCFFGKYVGESSPKYWGGAACQGTHNKKGLGAYPAIKEAYIKEASLSHKIPPDFMSIENQMRRIGFLKQGKNTLVVENKVPKGKTGKALLPLFPLYYLESGE